MMKINNIVAARRLSKNNVVGFLNTICGFKISLKVLLIMCNVAKVISPDSLQGVGKKIVVIQYSFITSKRTVPEFDPILLAR
jgi:hypothetical protein